MHQDGIILSVQHAATDSPLCSDTTCNEFCNKFITT